VTHLQKEIKIGEQQNIVVLVEMFLLRLEEFSTFGRISPSSITLAKSSLNWAPCCFIIVVKMN
jgi:hypothetical protein